MEEDQFAWHPDPQLAAASNAVAFMKDIGVADYAELVRCGDEEPERFHEALFKHVGLRFSRPYTKLIDESQGIALTRWCTGGATNMVLNALDRWRELRITARRQSYGTARMVRREP